MWLITNKKFEKHNQGLNYLQAGEYLFVTDEPFTAAWQDGICWHCEGNMLPRQGVDSKYCGLSGAHLAAALYREFQGQFIHRVKGNFILLQLKQDGFNIFSDHFGIRKFFYCKEGPEFVISNDLKAVSKIVYLKPSSAGMAIYALTYHFTGGYTGFESVFHNQPGEQLKFRAGSLHVKPYWHPDKLLDSGGTKATIMDIAEKLKSAVSATLDLARPVSLSLTGGADTRNVLSVLLSQGVRPHLYTYGNPLSNDCVKASSIAKGLGLEHAVHDIAMTSATFEHNARRIIRLAGGLASIHRVHRLLAVEAEAEFARQMYLGTLGGEYVKGVSEDDYIVPAIVYENWSNTGLSHNDLVRYTERKRLKIEAETGVEILSCLRLEPFMCGHAIRRKHCALSFITAHLHDAQDVNLYGTVMDTVYTPFLDIDYLELLFSSVYVFANKEQISNRYLKRIQNPLYGSHFLRETYPPLLQFKYSGEHKPNEVLSNKYIAAFLKALRKKTSPKYPPNFPLSQWMVDFVKKNLPPCMDYPAIGEVFDILTLMQDLESGPHNMNEAYWVKFTNPIMMRFLLEEYCG